MACTKLDKLIDQYANQMLPSATDDEINPVKLAKEKLKEDIIEEIVAEKRETYRKAVRKEMTQELEKARINYWKTFIVDGLFLAFLVGIVVNQCTDIITWIKTLEEDISERCIMITVVIVIIVFLIILFAFNYRYINKIE